MLRRFINWLNMCANPDLYRMPSVPPAPPLPQHEMPEAPSWMRRDQSCDCGRVSGLCPDPGECFVGMQLSDKDSRRPRGVSADLYAPYGDRIPTELPPPSPERPPLEDAIADCFEIGAREIETNIRTLHSAYTIALSEGLALASEFRLRGELERLRTRNSMELAKALVINFRERSAELRGDKPAAVSSAA